MMSERIEKLQQILRQNPHDDFLQHALALEYIKINNDDEAQKIFENLLKNNPQYIGSYYHLGKILERKGAEQQAKDVYRKGMEEARLAGDTHSYNELKSAWEFLEF